MISKSKGAIDMVMVNFSKSDAAQDMINIIMSEKNLSASQAVKYAINEKIYRKIVEAGYASIALMLWGHDDYDRKWKQLKNAFIEVDIDSTSSKLIDDIMERESVDFTTAITYFLLFTVETLGYHI